MIRVGFDVTVSSRAMTGVAVYAQVLEHGLPGTGVDLRVWSAALGPSGRRWSRLSNGARLAHWQTTGLGARACRDAVHLVHTATSIGPLRCQVPVVMTVHDATPVTHPIRSGPAERLFQRVYSVQAARRAAAVLAPTAVAADSIARVYGVHRRRIHVIPLGVDDRYRDVPAEHVSRVARDYRLPGRYVLFTGADTPRKNMGRLAAAMALVRRTRPDVVLVWAGPPAGDPRTYAALAADGGLRQLGYVPDADMPALYAGASCLAYVSIEEGFGLPIIEAFAAGTPVVTSNRSALSEVAGEAACLVDPTTTDAIAHGIGTVLDNEDEAARLRDAGRTRSLAFDWATTIKLTSDVYRLVAG